MVTYVYYRQLPIHVKRSRLEALSGSWFPAIIGDMEHELGEAVVREILTTRWLGRHYIYLDEVGSTNDYLAGLHGSGGAREFPAGTVVLAGHQSQGRGRHGRQWYAPAGTSLLMSILFRPDWPARQFPWLNMIVGMAAAETIEEQSGLTVGIKWPNDLAIWIDDEWLKIGGVLIEGSFTNDDSLEYAIAGIGINVNIPPGHMPAYPLPATSLLIATGRSFDRLSLLARFLQRLESRYEAVDQADSPLSAWKERLITLGKTVRVTDTASSQAFMGVAEDTDEWGSLLVRDATGRLHTVSAGDVTLRPSD